MNVFKSSLALTIQECVDSILQILTNIKYQSIRLLIQYFRMYNRKEFLRNRDQKDVGSIKENYGRLKNNKTQALNTYLTSIKEEPSPRFQQDENTSMFCRHCHRSEDSTTLMMKVLLDENSNLKQQNYFLQQQLSKIIEREKQLTSTIRQYESNMCALNSKNTELHHNIAYFNDKANSRVDKLKTAINQMIGDRRSRGRTTVPMEDISSEESFMRRQSFHNHGAFKRMNTQKGQCLRPKLIHRSPSADDLPFQSRQFSKLLQQCQNQNNPSRKKNLSKRLMDLTYERSGVVGYLS